MLARRWNPLDISLTRWCPPSDVIHRMREKFRETYRREDLRDASSGQASRAERSRSVMLAKTAVHRILQDPIHVPCDSRVHAGISTSSASVAPRHHANELVFLIFARRYQGPATVPLQKIRIPCTMLGVDDLQLTDPRRIFTARARVITIITALRYARLARRMLLSSSKEFRFLALSIIRLMLLSWQSREAYLTRIFLSFRVTRAQHIIRDHSGTVAGIATSLKAHNWNFDLLQETGWLAVFLQRAPTWCDRDCSDIVVIWKRRYYDITRWDKSYRTRKLP